MDVSVIIINYNTLELTENTITSVIEKTQGIKYEIILVDNASTDGSKKYFEEKYRNKIIFLKNKENLGFGRANNKGIEIAKGKYVFLLNSDTLLINNAIKILFDYMELNLEVGVCGANLYDIELNPAHSFKKELITLINEFDFFKNKIARIVLKKRLDFNYKDIPLEVGYITGADMFIRKKVLEESGSFDDDFFMYFEETELTYRIKKLGYIVVSVPEAKIIHLEGKSSIFKEKKIKMSFESKYKYFYKTQGEKEIRLAYLISQIKYLSIPTKMNIRKFQINKEEYKKFQKWRNGERK